MELTLKHKILIFSAMVAVFVLSIVLKQFVLTKDIASGYDDNEYLQMTQSVGELNESYSNINPYESVADIIIDVEGAVTYPGIVVLKEGCRVYEAVEKAGGLLEGADTKYVNLADFLEDGSIVYIPFAEENAPASSISSNEALSSNSSLSNEGSEKININTADIQKLVTLPGIGEAYARAIVDYRSSGGRFTDIKDIMKVSGIGEAKYEKIKDLICVY